MMAMNTIEKNKAEKSNSNIQFGSCNLNHMGEGEWRMEVDGVAKRVKYMVILHNFKK